MKSVVLTCAICVTSQGLSLPLTTRTSNASVSIMFLPREDANVISRGAITSEDINEISGLNTAVDLSHIGQIISSTGQCLNFLHIPKNAGSSMEQVSVKGSMKGWGRFDETLQCSQSGNCRAVPWPCIRGCKVSEQGMNGICSIWHMPPSADPKLERSYNGCDTFCIVRNPLTKLISQHMFEGGRCDATEFETKVRERITTDLKANIFSYDCHYLNQVEYVFGNTSQKPKPYCQHVLHFERLTSDFAALMAKYDFPLEAMPHSNKKHCSLNSSDISPDVLQLIEAYYAEDYETFGYTS